MTAEQQHDTTAEFNEALAGALETGNCDGLVPFYTEGATLTPPRGPYTVGRAEIGAFWLGVRNRFASMTFTTTDLKALDDNVRRETGTYVMQPVDADAPAPEGKYLFLWMLVEGEWQIESSIWNRNAEGGGGRRASQAGGQAQGGGRRQAGGPGAGYGQGGGGRQGGGRMGGGQGGGRNGGGQGGAYPGQGARRSGGGRMGGGAGVGGGRQNQGGGGQGGRRDARSLYDQSPGLYSNLDD